jgi:DNA-binding SARP family transcriptional activator
MHDLKLFLFGTPRLEYQGKAVTVERRKALALAAWLALQERPQSRDAVAALLWRDHDQEHARTSLRGTLPALTHASPHEWLVADRITLHLWARGREDDDRAVSCAARCR